MTQSTIATKSAWKKAGIHTVTLPSGTQVKIRIPNIAAMAKGGELDNDLLQYAVPDAKRLAEEATEEKTVEQKKENLTKLANYHAWLVSKTLVEPAMTPEEVGAPGAIPTPDIEVLVELASRRRDMDVVGHQIGGLEGSAEFRKFRGLDASEQDFLDA